MEILKGVFKKSIFIILPTMLLAGYCIEPRKVPLGIFMGALLGIVNLRQLSRNVEGFLGSQGATAKMLITGMLRLLFLGAAIFALIYYNVVNVFGLLFGFTVVFILIMVEGFMVGKAQE
ncbi:ATP synthase I chain [bacterium BMS3Abin09]|nr:ATP synthase I chain [bacterium BMS3Abin09]